MKFIELTCRQSQPKKTYYINTDHIVHITKFREEENISVVHLTNLDIQVALSVVQLLDLIKD